MTRPFPFLLLLFLSAALSAQDLSQRVDQLERKSTELESKLAALADEQESFSLAGLLPEAGAGRYGLGPSASKVYATEGGLSLGGYGEALYTNPSGSAAAEVDFLRLVLYAGYRFDERWVFNSEVEYEHGGEEVGVEFAYLDCLLEERLNLRLGMVLVPMGFLNELHEPPTFLGAKRPETERRILPTTWHENGLGLFGDAGDVRYGAYVLNGFDGAGYTSAGLRDGRQGGSEALAEDWAAVARVDWSAVPGLLLGGSAYRGDAGQDQTLDPDGGGSASPVALGDTTTTIGELHAEWRAHGLWTRALVALAQVDDAGTLNAALDDPSDAGDDAESVVGEELRGYYLEAGYDVLALLEEPCACALSPYVRYEAIDTQSEVPAGLAADPANDFDVLSFGLNFRPLTNLVFKLEYQDFERASDGFNLAMGFSF